MVEKEQLDNKIGEIVKVLLSYCRARTSNQWEAEELAQDIILALYQIYIDFFPTATGCYSNAKSL